jgi:hypothetical protein
MKIEEQVCSLDQAVKLRSLWLTLESLYSWMPTTTGWGIFETLDFASLVRENIEFFPAYTVAELGVLLPENRLSSGRLLIIDFDRCGDKFRTHLTSFSHEFQSQWFVEDTEAKSKTECLIWLIANKLLKVEDLKL